MGSKGGINFASIRDGLSNTLLAGEKHVPLNYFGIGGWDCSTYNGDYFTCCTRSAGPAYPLARTKTETGWKFGSYHSQICQFTFADGSVRPISVNIDPKTLGLLAQRDDGEVIPDY